MSYSDEHELTLPLREVLFLHLALQSNQFIESKMGCCERTVTDYNKDLMRICCGEGVTEIKKIYYAAKSNKDLCNDLADEFGHRYPGLEDEVRKSHTVRYERVEKDGEVKRYVFKN